MSDDGRFDLIETITNEGIKSELLIRNADRRDGGLYTCITANSFGRDDTNVQLLILGSYQTQKSVEDKQASRRSLIVGILLSFSLATEPPDAPTDIKVSERDGRALRLVWSTPYSGNSPLTHYVVQHKLENGKYIWSKEKKNTVQIIAFASISSNSSVE